MATELGVDVQTLLPRARRSVEKVNGEYLWLVEMWDLTFAEEYWAWKAGLYPLKQFQAAQLGSPFLQVRDRKGERILTNAGAIVSGKERAAIQWCRTLDPDMPLTLTIQQALQYIQTNQTNLKIKALFDAFEAEPIT
jgi:hypothetical protein